MTSLNISPFLLWELKVGLRQPARGGRFVAAAIVAVILFFGLVFAFDHSPRKVGQGLFDLLLIGGVIAVVLAAQRASFLFAEERRNGTLGILFSTGITATEVLVGKLAGMVILPLSWLLTLVPGLVVIWLMRGATSEVCVTALALLVTLLALALAMNLFGSLLFEEHSSARTFADGLLTALVLAIPALNWLNRMLTGTPLDDAFLALSPGYGVWTLFKDPRLLNLGMVHLSIAYSALLAIILFGASAWRVGRMWQDQTTGLNENPRFIGKFQEFLRARRKIRKNERLDANPYHWLIVRDFSPALLSWLVVGTLLGLWLAAWAAWGRAWLQPMNFWATFLVLSAVVRWMISYIAARQVGTHRATGRLELMLTTGLTVDEIIGGQRAAMRSYARPFFIFFSVLAALFFVGGLVARPMHGLALVNYTVIWIGVLVVGPWFDSNSYWKAFWVSLNTGRPGLAMRKHLWEQGVFTSIYVQMFLNRSKLGGLPTGSFAESCVVLIVGACLLLVLVFYKMGWVKTDNPLEKKALQYLRPIAAEPVPELNDPRLKGWNQNKPLFFDEPVDQKIWV